MNHIPSLRIQVAYARRHAFPRTCLWGIAISRGSYKLPGVDRVRSFSNSNVPPYTSTRARPPLSGASVSANQRDPGSSKARTTAERQRASLSLSLLSAFGRLTPTELGCRGMTRNYTFPAVREAYLNGASSRLADHRCSHKCVSMCARISSVLFALRYPRVCLRSVR